MSAQSFSEISFGLRGGASAILSSPAAKGKIGPDGLFDLNYACYWQTNGTAQIGIKTGANFGWSSNKFQNPLNETFSNVDYEGNTIDYTVTSSLVEEKTSNWRMEIPFMLAIRADGFFFEIGPKFVLTLADSYEQTFSDLNIDAYYSLRDVHVRNELITGVLDQNQYSLSGKGVMPMYNMYVGLSLGYEWNVGGNNRIGLGAFFDICPLNNFSVRNHPENVVTVSPIIDPTNPPAVVNINLLSDVSSEKLMPMSFGLKFYYALDLPN